MSLIYQWIDLVWIPIALLVAHKPHRLLTAGLILICALSLRLQVELMDSIGFDTGILSFMNTPLFQRGIMVYGFVIALFLVLAYFSPRTSKMVFFAAGLSIYILAVCLSTIIMIL